MSTNHWNQILDQWPINFSFSFFSPGFARFCHVFCFFSDTTILYADYVWNAVFLFILRFFDSEIALCILNTARFLFSFIFLPHSRHILMYYLLEWQQRRDREGKRKKKNSETQMMQDIVVNVCVTQKAMVEVERLTCNFFYNIALEWGSGRNVDCECMYSCDDDDSDAEGNQSYSNLLNEWKRFCTAIGIRHGTFTQCIAFTSGHQLTYIRCAYFFFLFFVLMRAGEYVTLQLFDMTWLLPSFYYLSLDKIRSIALERGQRRR